MTIIIAKHVLSSLFIFALTFLSVAGLAQQALPEPQTQSETPGRWDPPFWAGARPLWFGYHPTGHELTVAEVKDGLQRWIGRSGNPRLMAGNVVAKDSRTITAEIVTVDNSLVQKLDIDRRTGMVWQMQRPDGWGAWHRWEPPHWMDRSRHCVSDWRGWMPFPFFGMMLFIVFAFCIALVIAVVLWRTHGGRRFVGPNGLSASDELNRRYALGEIGRKEYLRSKKTVSG